jgi:hypothetical protein
MSLLCGCTDIKPKKAEEFECKKSLIDSIQRISFATSNKLGTLHILFVGDLLDYAIINNASCDSVRKEWSNYFHDLDSSKQALILNDMKSYK